MDEPWRRYLEPEQPSLPGVVRTEARAAQADDLPRPAQRRTKRIALKERIDRLMLDKQWRTLREISAAVGGLETSVSARLRELRRSPYNRSVDHRQRDGAPDGTREYRVGFHAER